MTRTRKPIVTVSPPQNSIYLIGPMRGIPLYNFPAFDDAADRWRKHGWTVISPAELDREAGFDERTSHVDTQFLRGAFARDFAKICTVDAVALRGKNCSASPSSSPSSTGS